MTKLDSVITDKVRELREKYGYTPNDLASITGISASFINSVESKKSHEKYNLKHLSKIAFLFGCKISDFLPDNFKDTFDNEELNDLKIEKSKIELRLENKLTRRR